MTTESALPGDEPRRLLAGARALANRVRRDQRATWFPLVVLAAVVLVAIPVDGDSGPTRACRTVGAITSCAVAPSASFVYWPVALVLAYVAIAAWYLRKSRARGVGTRVWPYAVAGIVIALVAAAAALWGHQHILLGELPALGGLQAQTLLFRLGNPGTAIGLGLLVLARVERNPALLAVAVGYLVIVLVPLTFGWTIAGSSPWSIVPHLAVQGLVLLLAGVGFAVAHHARRSRA